MMRSTPSTPRIGRQSAVLLTVTMFCFFGLLSQSGLAQQVPSAQTAAPEAVPWVVGPGVANLGDSAQITVPAGCRFTDQNGARRMLSNSKNPVPENVVGLLLSESRHWFSVIQFEDIGYVKDAGKHTLDADAILRNYQSDITRQNKARGDSRASLSGLSWEIKPTYDATQDRLEYALKAENSSGGSVNYVVSWLGRHGVLSVTTVLPYQANINNAAVREALGGITFKDGERYADHQSSDRIAQYNLAELIIHADGVEPPTRWQRLAGNHWLWAGAAAALLLAGYGLTVLVLKKYKARYYRLAEKRQRGALGAPRPLAANGHAVNGNGQPYPAYANGQPVLASGFQRNGHRRRKKHFSYHAFYSDMVMNLTRSNYVGSPGPLINANATDFAGTPVQNPGEHSAASMTDTASLLVAETSKLLQSQQKLIEGQRKLIEEQSKLIQEKTMLLDAENRALGKQSEAVKEQQLT